MGSVGDIFLFIEKKLLFIVFENSLLSSCTSLYNCSTSSFSSEKLASAWDHGHPHPRMYVLYILGLRVRKRTRFCVELPPSLAVLKYHLPLAFENSLSGSVHPCTLPDASFCCTKTSLLTRTTDIPVRSETTRREHKLTAGVSLIR